MAPSASSPERAPRTARIEVGTSGFGYHEWCPSFYPPGLCYDAYLDHYARHFRFLELSAYFFRMPDRAEAERLAARLPEGLQVTVKLHRGLTHERPKGIEPARRFGERLGPIVDSGHLRAVVAQFPFSFVNNPPSRAYLCRLKAALGLPLVVELRNDSWLDGETLAFLRGWGIGFVSADLPALGGLSGASPTATSDIGYVRFHGRRADAWWRHRSRERYDYRYTRRELLSWLPRIREIARSAGTHTFVVFNNRRQGHAVSNARTMAKLLERSMRRRRAKLAARAG